MRRQPRRSQSWKEGIAAPVGECDKGSCFRIDILEKICGAERMGAWWFEGVAVVLIIGGRKEGVGDVRLSRWATMSTTEGERVLRASVVEQEQSFLPQKMPVMGMGGSFPLTVTGPSLLPILTTPPAPSPHKVWIHQRQPSPAATTPFKALYSAVSTSQALSPVHTSDSVNTATQDT